MHNRHWQTERVGFGKRGCRQISQTRRKPPWRRLAVEPLEPRLALSVTVLSEDFQDDPVGGLPNTADQWWNAAGPEAFIQVAGAGGTYTAPAGGAANRMLVIDDAGAAQPIVAWRSVFADDPTQFVNGSFEFDVYLPPTPSGRDWTFLDFRVGYGGPNRTAPTTAGDTTIWNSFRLNPGAPQGFILDDNTGTFLAAFTPGTLLHLKYDLNSTARTYRLTVNGSLASPSGNPDRPWRAGATGVNMFGFFGSAPADSAPVYVDNIVVVNGTTPPAVWAPPADEPTNRLEWHQHRGNKRLTGEATFHQDIVTGAQVLWSEFVGSRESWFAVAPSSSEQLVTAPTQAISMSQSERISWGIGGPYFDLAGNGNLTAESTSSIRRVGDFIPGNGKLEKLEGEVFDPTFGQGVVRLSIYQNGGWVQQWQSPQIPAMFGIPNLIVGDFDADGTNEVALTPWNNVYVLNINTGAIERTGAFKPAANESGRGYGWFGAYDLAGDSRSELVVMGDFQDFISVLGWDENGNLVQLWTRVFDPKLTGKQTAHRPMAFPVRDIDGDGRPEIVTSVYNETGDHRWHLIVLDAATGSVRHDLVDHAIDGARDIDGDGDFELFVRATQGALLPEMSTIKILDWAGGGFHTVWSHANAAFVRQDMADFPANMNSATSTGKSDLLTGPIVAGGDDVFFTRQLVDAAANESLVGVWQFDGAGGAMSLGTARATGLDAIALRPAATGQSGVLLSTEFVGAAGMLPGDYDANGRVDAADFTLWRNTVGSSAAPGSGADGNGSGLVDQADYDVWRANFGRLAPHVVALAGLSGAPVYSQLGSPPRSSVVVGRLDGPTSPPTVVLQGGSETIAALRPNSAGSAVHLWTRAGIGGFTGATQFQGQHEFSGVALADVDGGGDLEVLYATRGEAGQARLVAADALGNAVWHHDFDVPGGPRVWNQPGLTLWRSGHFRSKTREDVLVQLMRGSGGTGEFQLLDGLTGQVVWTRTYGPTPGGPLNRNAGEAQMAVYDWDGDGLDEAVNFHPDMYYVVDGTGVNLVDRPVYNGGVFPGGSPLYGTPIVADFLDNQTDAVLFAGSYAQLGLVTKTGQAIWNTPFTFDNTPGFIQGVGDVDGDGDLDLLSVAHPSAPGVDTQSRFRAYDAATGTLLWSVNLPGHAHAPTGGAYHDTPTLSVSGDVDNDGRVESVFAIGSTLYVVGANPGGTSGQVEWTYTPDAGLLGSPVLADGDGDGRAEIIVASTSGRVYGIGRRQLGAVAAAMVDDLYTATGPVGSAIERERPAIRPTPRGTLLLDAIDRTAHVEAAFAAYAETGPTEIDGAEQEDMEVADWQGLADQLLRTRSLVHN